MTRAADASPWYALIPSITMSGEPSADAAPCAGAPRGSSLPSPSRLSQLVEMDVDHEAIPKPLEHVEDEALFPVEEPEAEHVAVEEIEARPDVERQPRPPSLEPAGPVVRRAVHPGLPRARCPRRGAAKLLPRLEGGVPRVLGDPGRDVLLVAVVLDQVRLEPRRRPLHVEVVVHQVPTVRPRLAAPEQLQQVLGIVAAVSDPPAAKDLSAPHVVAHGPAVARLAGRQPAVDLLAKLRRQPLVSVERQHPIRRQRQRPERPLPLAGVTHEGVRHHVGPVPARDRDGLVGAARVHHEHPARPSADAREAGRQVPGLVVREHHHVDRGARSARCCLPAHRATLAWHLDCSDGLRPVGSRGALATAAADSLVQLDELRPHRAPRETLPGHPLAGTPPGHPPAPVAQRGRQRFAERGGVRRDYPPGARRRHERSEVHPVAQHHRDARRHRLGGRQPEVLLVRGQYEQPSAAEGGKPLGTVEPPDEEGPAVAVESFRALAESQHVGRVPVARDHQPPVGPVPVSQTREGLEQELETFLGVEPREEQHVGPAGQPHMPVGEGARCRWRIEQLVVNAERDHRTAAEPERQFREAALLVGGVVDRRRPLEHPGDAGVPQHALPDSAPREAPWVERAEGAHHVRHAAPAARSGRRQAGVREHRVHVQHVELSDVAVQPARERPGILERLAPLPGEEPRRYRRVGSPQVAEPRGSVRVGAGNLGVDAHRPQGPAHREDYPAGPAIARRQRRDHVERPEPSHATRTASATPFRAARRRRPKWSAVNRRS